MASIDTRASEVAMPSQPHQTISGIITKLQHLSQRVSQDRIPYIPKDFLLHSVVVGEGFVAGKRKLNEEDEESDNEDDDEELPLFLNEPLPNNDTPYNPKEGLRDEDEDLVPEEEEEVDIHFDENIKWLNDLKSHIEEFHSITSASCPSLAIPARSHQQVALGKTEWISKSPLKAIMIADPMGLGKTLVAIMAVANAAKNARRPSVIIVTSSCLKQWEREIQLFLKEDSVRLVVLRDPNTSPAELLKHDIVLVSYGFAMSQFRKLSKYLNSVESNKQGIINVLKRPNLTIFSDIFYTEERGPYLVLDEVTAIKNTSSATFQAIEELRKLFDTCIMLTGSLPDNTWMDTYAYSQLVLSHEIHGKLAMRALFARRQKKRWIPPVGNTFRRFMQLLNSFVIRRPETIISLPPLNIRTEFFSLTHMEQLRSDEHAEIYELILRIRSSDPVRSDEIPPWKRLTLATQHACHPALEKIMDLVKNPTEADDEDPAAADVLTGKDEIQQWVKWRDEIKFGDNWKSSRIIKIIDVFNEFRDKDPDCSVIIFDESVYFLDIVEIAFSNMFEPEACLRYDGRTVEGKRSAILEAFAALGGPRVLLASRGAGGIGLNITTANKVILCCPWWKVELGKQAIKRVHRDGQKRPVEAVYIQAHCIIESLKARKRDYKHKHNMKVMNGVERVDGIIPKAWDDLD